MGPGKHLKLLQLHLPVTNYGAIISPAHKRQGDGRGTPKSIPVFFFFYPFPLTSELPTHKAFRLEDVRLKTIQLGLIWPLICGSGLWSGEQVCEPGEHSQMSQNYIASGEPFTRNVCNELQV